MDDDAFQVTPPRHLNAKRLQRKADSSPEVILQQQRVKREMNYTRELIDFDLIKGSALFHTKPTSHDRKLVQEGLSRALFVPFHAKFWRQKPWFYKTATVLYSLHVVAVCIYLFRPKTTSAMNSFEVAFPMILLLLVAIGYGRVSSALQMPDADPVTKILSPILKQVTDTTCGSESDNSLAASGLEPGLAESENSDGTDSDEDSGNSSSSSDESNSNDIMFPHKSSSAPSSPKRVRLLCYALFAGDIVHLRYAKCFTALTSSRRSRLANLPHFRLKNVINIKAWISLRGGRTWLKRQGRQRAADEVVSTSFLVILVLLVVMGMQAVSDGSGSLQPESVLHIEVAIWCMFSSVFMLRFMMLGSNINKKYQNTSLLLTEQMNVYLRLLAKPHKKEKLLVSNNVLKLACKLLKVSSLSNAELNSPNKVSGLTMNPLLYNITRVVVLSAFSSTASDFFGFKLKLWKLKA
ncbi:hypothetical protein BBJ29_007969 [Phytophthora kernoviae]|uniref:PHTF1/2 N-terminal domain-containing protein n=1 Tax=Phytophthora kernoviae TaxID=325452 RepID=A0A3F2RK51_9STRA|nr:hypothetical protein BBJ29_007969 [Phytophthora kernoviae]RLN59002.1 hypothetical protein BBP00_00006733 [Phytophthora kernoviae]